MPLELEEALCMFQVHLTATAGLWEGFLWIWSSSVTYVVLAHSKLWFGYTDQSGLTLGTEKYLFFPSSFLLATV